MKSSPAQIAYMKRWRPLFILSIVIMIPVNFLTLWLVATGQSQAKDLLVPAGILLNTVGQILSGQSKKASLAFLLLGCACVVAYMVLYINQK